MAMKTQRDIGYLDQYLDLFSSPSRRHSPPAPRPARDAAREDRP